MRQICLIIAGLVLLTGLAVGGEIQLSITDVPTNTSAVASGTVTNDAQANLYGYVDALVFDFTLGGSGSYTCDVDVVTAGWGPERIIFSADDLTSANDGVVYPVRDLGCTTAGADITGAAVKMPLFHNQVVLRTYGKNVTNTLALTVYVLTTSEAGD
jgi:hypothetical protein